MGNSTASVGKGGKKVNLDDLDDIDESKSLSKGNKKTRVNILYYIIFYQHL